MAGDVAGVELRAAAFDAWSTAGVAEADEFYAAVIPPGAHGRCERRVMRQALAGMLWGKQFYRSTSNAGSTEHGAAPFERATGAAPRNAGWHHMDNADVFSMPDKWEYPWFAAWDLAFHVDRARRWSTTTSASASSLLMLRAPVRSIPNGQLPAYEWNFGDVNPPVHAWATISTRPPSVGRADRRLRLARALVPGLILNFNWWVNRKDRNGSNLFEGGFLGLDNIGIFDRSSPLPGGGHLEQADGTAWMALFSQNLLDIALELASRRTAVRGDAQVPRALHVDRLRDGPHRRRRDGMWDEEDGFFYDVLRLPDGTATRLKVRSMVGLLPLCAVHRASPAVGATYPQIAGPRCSGSSSAGRSCASSHP